MSLDDKLRTQNAGSKTWNSQNIRSEHLISLLSRRDTFALFIAAKKGIKYSPQVVEKMGLSRKRYYNALSQLNRRGLIRKDQATGRSIHTVFGEMIYRCVLEMHKYAEHCEELRMIDTLKRTGEFTPDRIMKFLEMVGDGENIASSMFGTFEVVWSYESMVSLLLEHIRGCRSEILVATRLLSEEIIRALLAKAIQGAKVRILSEASLVESYFAMQRIPSNDATTYHTQERIEIARNPWYQDKRIERRITNVPFGMIIIDATKVGIELINAHNLSEFSGGLLVQDLRIAEGMKNYFQKLWTQSKEFTSFCEGRSAETEA
jgi:sugar-specific transcriptional regulator TrmB